MADTSATKTALRAWALKTHTEAYRGLSRKLYDATPVETGHMAAASRRVNGATSPSVGFGRISRHISAPAGRGEPSELPTWLDQDRRFTIVPVRARALRFRSGGRIVFARRVHWRPRPTSVRFWTRTVNAAGWRRELKAAAQSNRGRL